MVDRLRFLGYELPGTIVILGHTGRLGISWDNKTPKRGGGRLLNQVSQFPLDPFEC